MHKQRKNNGIRDLIGASVTTSVGSNLLSSLPASTVSTNASAGLAAFSTGLPVVGSLLGAGMVLNSLKNLQDTQRERLNKRVRRR